MVFFQLQQSLLETLALLALEMRRHVKGAMGPAVVAIPQQLLGSATIDQVQRTEERAYHTVSSQRNVPPGGRQFSRCGNNSGRSPPAAGEPGGRRVNRAAQASA
jgi:hypothetical protein